MHSSPRNGDKPHRRVTDEERAQPLGTNRFRTCIHDAEGAAKPGVVCQGTERKGKSPPLVLFLDLPLGCYASLHSHLPRASVLHGRRKEEGVGGKGKRRVANFAATERWAPGKVLYTEFPPSPRGWRVLESCFTKEKTGSGR